MGIRRSNILPCISFIAIFGLSACATRSQYTEQKPPTPTTHSAKSPSSASALSSWNLSGAIAVKNQKKAWTASMYWHQQGPHQYQIRLYGPLGGGTVIIEQKNGQITYRDGSTVLTSTHADALLLKKTGVRLPVEHLYYWIRGLPAPGAVQSSQYDETHRLITLQQAGFRIHYSDYTQINTIHLPRKIQLQGPNVFMKCVIKQWQ